MNTRQKRSPIWKISRNELEELVSQSQTIGDVLSFFGMKNHGSNYKTLKNRLDADGIDSKKFSGNFGHGLLKPFIPLEQVLTDNSNYNRGLLKKRLLKSGMLENKCSKCGQEPFWNGEKLVMVLDHINGVNNDHRWENLRLLCPNCNSQTSTFCGRNSRMRNSCGICGKRVAKGTSCCRKCNAGEPRPSRRKVIRPTAEQLAKDIAEMNWVALGKKYGVSDNAVRKWARAYSLI